MPALLHQYFIKFGSITRTYNKTQQKQTEKQTNQRKIEETYRKTQTLITLWLTIGLR